MEPFSIGNKALLMDGSNVGNSPRGVGPVTGDTEVVRGRGRKENSDYNRKKRSPNKLMVKNGKA